MHTPQNNASPMGMGFGIKTITKVANTPESRLNSSIRSSFFFLDSMAGLLMIRFACVFTTYLPLLNPAILICLRVGADLSMSRQFSGDGYDKICSLENKAGKNCSASLA